VIGGEFIFALIDSQLSNRAYNSALFFNENEN